MHYLHSAQSQEYEMKKSRAFMLTTLSLAAIMSFQAKAVAPSNDDGGEHVSKSSAHAATLTVDQLKGRLIDLLLANGSFTDFDSAFLVVREMSEDDVRAAIVSAQVSSQKKKLGGAGGFGGK